MVRLTFFALVAVWPFVPEMVFLMVAPILIAAVVARAAWRLA